MPRLFRFRTIQRPFGNLSWRAVFTDPALVDLIDRALDNNKDLRNAKLNIDIAHAQLKGRSSELSPLARLRTQRRRVPNMPTMI